jgi:MYXO-CTERM domain-containing protein
VRFKHLLVAGLAACSVASHAAVVFSDDFEGATLGLNTVPTGWTVQDGTVDVVSDATFPGLCTTGRCVDLDGSSGNAGVLSRELALLGGIDYLLTFDLSGNRRSGADDVTVRFGDATLDITGLLASTPTANFALLFTPVLSGDFTLSFANAGGDNVGAMLDNVVVSSLDVPEPGTAALGALALAGLVGTRRRRR